MSKNSPKKFKKYIVFSILFIFVFSTVASLIVTMIPGWQSDDQNPYQLDQENLKLLENIMNQTQSNTGSNMSWDMVTDFTWDENINYTWDNINIITWWSNYSWDNYIMETDIMSWDVYTWNNSSWDNMTWKVE